jgi:TPR repeat protein
MSLNTTLDSLDEEPQYIVAPTKHLARKFYFIAGEMGDSEAANCGGLLVEKEDPVDAI